MRHHDPRAEPEAKPATARAERRRYVRPTILHRQSIEAMAAECSFPGGKTDPTCAVGFS